MTFLPIVERELRAASRRRWTYWGRTCSGLALVFVVSWIFLMEQGVGSASLARTLFSVSGFLLFVFALISGSLFSADSISSERREGTLGLLFLTDLRGYDVAIGKLTSSSVNGLFCLFAPIPVVGLPLLLGGVSPGEYWRVVLVLVLTLVCSLNLGLLASTFATDGRRSGGLALAFMGGLLMLGPMGGGILEIALDRTQSQYYFDGTDILLQSLGSTSPGMTFSLAFDGAYKVDAPFFWAGCGFNFFIAMGALTWASLRLPKVWQDRAVSVHKIGFRARLEAWRWPTLTHKNRFRTHMLEVSPMVWLLSRHWLRFWIVWGFLGFTGLIYGILALKYGRDWVDLPAYIVTSCFLHMTLKMWIANEAPRQFAEDRQGGGLELLLSTPLDAPEILNGRVQALQRMFAKPILLVLAVDVLFILAIQGQDFSSGDHIMETFWISRMVLLVADAYALAWTGMWRGMKSVSGRTFLGVVVRVLGIPWFITFGLLALMAVLSMSDAMVDGVGGGEALICWTLIGLGTSAFYFINSRMDLQRNFRSLASQPMGKKSSPPLYTKQTLSNDGAQ